MSDVASKSYVVCLCMQADESSVVVVAHTRVARKKRKGPTICAITEVFSASNPYKKGDEQQQMFLEDLVLYIAKDYRPLSTMENVWLRRLMLRQSPHVVFPSRMALTDDVVPAMAQYFLPSLASCVTGSASFGLWMSRGGINIFALVISFINEKWVTIHVIMGLFEVSDISVMAMAVQLQGLLDAFTLTERIISFVKDKGGNLATIATLKSVMSYGPLQRSSLFEGTRFRHVMSKACQYAKNDAKVSMGYDWFRLKMHRPPGKRL